MDFATAALQNGVCILTNVSYSFKTASLYENNEKSMFLSLSENYWFSEEGKSLQELNPFCDTSVAKFTLCSMKHRFFATFKRTAQPDENEGTIGR